MQFAELRSRSPDVRIGKRLAALGHTVALVAGVKGLTDNDFDPFYVKSVAPPREQTWQEQKAIVEAMNKRLGGLDLRKAV